MRKYRVHFHEMRFKSILGNLSVTSVEIILIRFFQKLPQEIDVCGPIMEGTVLSLGDCLINTLCSNLATILSGFHGITFSN